MCRLGAQVWTQDNSSSMSAGAGEQKVILIDFENMPASQQGSCLKILRLQNLCALGTWLLGPGWLDIKIFGKTENKMEVISTS